MNLSVENIIFGKIQTGDLPETDFFRAGFPIRGSSTKNGHNLCMYPLKITFQAFEVQARKTVTTYEFIR